MSTPAPAIQGVIFEWNPQDYAALIASCDHDEATPRILDRMPRDGRIVEAGCGLARYVRYLADRGYAVEGVEANPDAVRAVRALAPDLEVIEGDIMALPYADGALAGMISLGVIEHFRDGMAPPLAEALRVLRPGGVLVISVPSLSLVRRIKRTLFLHEIGWFLNPVAWARRSNGVRRMLGKPPAPRTRGYNRFAKAPYAIHPMFGAFFEYRLAPRQYEDLIRRAGFEIVESVPIGHIDGIHHDIGRWLAPFSNWTFRPTRLGRLLDAWLRKIRFGHNHMHLIVAVKPGGRIPADPAVAARPARVPSHLPLR